MNALTRLRPTDPAELGYPPTLPIEIAMRVAPVKEICDAYNISKEEFDRIKLDPGFLSELKAAHDMLKEEGMSFKLKARLQAEELLKTSWKLIHGAPEDVPASVKADLIKSTVKWAGLEPKAGAGEVAAGSGFQINIQLNNGDK